MAKNPTKRGSNKLSQAENIRNYIRKYPEKSVSEVAKAMGTTYQIVYMTKKNMKDKELKLPKTWVLTHVSTSDNSIETAMEKELAVTLEEPAADPVNHPAHYKVGGIETIDFIEAKGLNYRLGNAVKYITRADHKGNRKQDLEKALWYLQREINSISA